MLSHREHDAQHFVEPDVRQAAAAARRRTRTFDSRMRLELRSVTAATGKDESLQRFMQYDRFLGALKGSEWTGARFR